MNYLVFDTETTSLDKPFCYNIGYVICNENGEMLLQRDFVIKQVWYNLPLFSSSYYAEKRNLYINSLRSRKAQLEYFGYVCRTISRDIEQYEVHKCFAFNCKFDIRVFEFNCEWFKVVNPFETCEISDIRGFAHRFLIDKKYYDFCDKFELYNESGNYSTSADTFGKMMYGIDFAEEHTALADSRLENSILRECVSRGANLNDDYPARKSIERLTTRNLELITPENTYNFNYTKIRINKDKTKIKLS